MRALEVQPNWEKATPEELRVAMEAAPNRRSYIRLQALRGLLLGFSRAQVCTLCARSDHMVRLWIEWFNRGGIDALRTKQPGHRPGKVKLERVRDLLVPVLDHPAQAGGVHWTGVKGHGYLKEQLCMDLDYRTPIRWWHELNFHLRFPRPWPERQNEEERQAFLAGRRGWTAAPPGEVGVQ